MKKTTIIVLGALATLGAISVSVYATALTDKSNSPPIMPQAAAKPAPSVAVPVSDSKSALSPPPDASQAISGVGTPPLTVPNASVVPPVAAAPSDTAQMIAPDTATQPLAAATPTVAAAPVAASPPAAAQLIPPAPVPPPVEATAPPAPKGPSFESNGLKATIDTVAGQRVNVSLSLLLQNISKEKLMVAVIGPPMGTNGGHGFFATNVSGVPFCAKPVEKRQRIDYDARQAAHNKFCLFGTKPELDFETFAVLDAGSAIPVTMSLKAKKSVDLNNSFAFSMAIAVFKEADLRQGAASANSLTSGQAATKPASLRFTSVGISNITFENKKPEPE
ncbi:MAG: hypothetical protein ACXWT1_03915 [Methylobacter sp.]